jgi:hypothetical protein
MTKLAAIYSVFDGEELLEQSILSIREHVDVVIAISQKQSNFGEQNDAGFIECERLRSLGIVDIHHEFHPKFETDAKNFGTHNEKDKRNLGLQLAKEIHCTHFLFVDCDEFYVKSDFQKAFQLFLDSKAEGSVVSIQNHFKFPQWAFSKLETFYVPFIHVLKLETEVYNPNYPFACDATRTINTQEVIFIQPEICIMQHYGWIRKDLQKKIRNSSATSKLNLYLPFIENDIVKAEPGYQLCKYFDYQQLKYQEPLFEVSVDGIKHKASDFKILIQFPTRSRPDRFFETLDLYIKQAHHPNNLFFSVICDEDDLSMNNPEVKRRLKDYSNLRVSFGKGEGKIAAVNAPFLWDEFDIILLASDDMIPQVKGYDQIIQEKMFKHYPDTDGILWFNDGHQGKRLNTLVIIGKKYYQRFNYLYHPSYQSLYCDKEFTHVGNLLGKQTYFEETIIRHVHPSIDQNKHDALYETNDKYEKIDFDNFNRRASIGFDLKEYVEEQKKIRVYLKKLAIKIKMLKFFGLHTKL